MKSIIAVYCFETTGSPGRRLTRFTSPDVTNTTMLLLSEDGDRLYVGARDAVIALDTSHEDVILLRSKVGVLSECKCECRHDSV